MSEGELAKIRDRQLRALRSATPPWWYFTGFGLLLVASTLGREVRTSPWAIVGFVAMPVGLITLLVMVDRVRRVKVIPRGRKAWILFALWAVACAVLVGSGYLLARLTELPYPETVGAAVFAVLFATTGPVIIRRIYETTIG